MSRPLIATALLAAALGSATTAWLVASDRATPTPTPEAAGVHARPAPARVPERRGLDLRPSIEQEEQLALPGLHGRADVEAYLERLEDRARAQGRATAVEIEPGMTAIFALRGTVPERDVLALADDFDARMQALQGDAPPPVADPQELRRAIDEAEGPHARELAVQRYVEAVENLPREQAETLLAEVARGDLHGASLL